MQTSIILKVNARTYDHGIKWNQKTCWHLL